jgi:hypothetical protein
MPSNTGGHCDDSATVSVDDLYRLSVLAMVAVVVTALPMQPYW